MVPRSFTQVQLFLCYTSSSDSPWALDLQARNILLRIEDPTVLRDAEDDEFKEPSSRKITGLTTIFETRDLLGPLRRWIGERSRPVLCDFGEARTGKGSYEELIQPHVYRAPEVFLKLPWGTPVDIWNLGCMVSRISVALFLAFLFVNRYGTLFSVDPSSPSVGEVHPMD